MHLPIIDRSDYPIAALAMIQGWGIGYLAAIWLALPMWAQTAIQGLLTLALGLGVLTAQHFWRQYLNRRWPDQEERKEENS